MAEQIPVGFYFNVQVDGVSGVPADNSFMEVSGISVEARPVEAYTKQDGLNNNIPLRPQFSNLILKRGLVVKGSQLTTWCVESLSADLTSPITTKNILVSLLNEQGAIRIGWYFVNAFPVKWGISDLNSMENAIVIETMEFSYDFFKIVNP